MAVLIWGLILVLTIVIYQDVRKRTIHAFLPCMLLIISCVLNFNSKELNFYDTLYNILFVAINILGVILYFSIKRKNFVNPIDKQIGLGDVVFFIAMAPLFNLQHFMLFFIFGLLFSLITHGIFLVFKDTKTIPLAGYLALFLIINVAGKSLLNIKTLYHG